MLDTRVYPHPGSTAFKKVKSYTLSLNPASVAANVSAEQDFTVAGVKAGDIVVAANPAAALSAALGVGPFRVKADDTISAIFTNPTAGAVDITASNWTFIVATPA